MRSKSKLRLHQGRTLALVAALLALTVNFLACFFLGVTVGARLTGEQEAPSGSAEASQSRLSILSAFADSLHRAVADQPETVVKGASGRGWSDVFEGPETASRRISQALIGDRMRVLERKKGWVRASLVGHGLTGWLAESQVVTLGPRERELWKAGQMRTVVKAPGTSSQNGFFLPFAACLPTVEAGDETVKLLSPDGQILKVDARHVRDLNQLPSLAEVLQEAKHFQGVSYEIGANSAQAMDASGLVYLIYRAAGMPVARHVQQQIGQGEGIDPAQISSGDVVFLDTFDPTAPRPVVILDESGVYLGASPARGTGFGLLQQNRNRKILSIRRYLF